MTMQKLVREVKKNIPPLLSSFRTETVVFDCFLVYKHQKPIHVATSHIDPSIDIQCHVMSPEIRHEKFLNLRLRDTCERRKSLTGYPRVQFSLLLLLGQPQKRTWLPATTLRTILRTWKLPVWRDNPIPYFWERFYGKLSVKRSFKGKNASGTCSSCSQIWDNLTHAEACSRR